MKFCTALAALLMSGSVWAAVEQPNVVIIFTDDQGYGDVGCYGGAEGYATPEIDRMAAEGMRFTEFNVANCVCTPSRAALLTGRYAERWGYKGGVFFPRSKVGMPTDEVTIAELLKAEGYATALVGKWHLGHLPEFLPTRQGFDSYFGIPYSNDMAQDGAQPTSSDMKFLQGMTRENYEEYSPTKVKQSDRSGYVKYKDLVPLMRDEEVIEWPVDQARITGRFTREAQTFITAHQDKPFFLYLAHSMPHTPLFASEKFKGRTERGIYGDVIEEIDHSVGEVLKTLRETGLDQKTLVIFTSDNGPWLIKGDHGGSAGPLREGKGSSYEGGQRVPAVAWWPGTVPASVVCDEHVTALDLLPTICSLAGAQVPEDRVIDGIDLAGLLTGESSTLEQRDFFLYARNEGIRIGDWKYRKGSLKGAWSKKSKDGEKKNPVVVQLFNLKEDPNERTNLAEKYPEKVAEMAAKLKKEYSALAPAKAE